MFDEIKAVFTATIEPYKKKIEEIQNLNKKMENRVKVTTDKVKNTFSNIGGGFKNKIDDIKLGFTVDKSGLGSKISEINARLQDNTTKADDIHYKIKNTDNPSKLSYLQPRESQLIEKIDIDVSELDKLQEKLDKINNSPISKLKNVFSGITERVKGLNDRLNGTKSATDKVSKSSINMSNNLSKGFNKGLNSLKRFGLSLFSIQTLFSGISKASSAYLSIDTELGEKLQSVWVGFGSFFAPIIEYLSNLLLNFLSIVNSVVKALTRYRFYCSS